MTLKTVLLTAGLLTAGLIVGCGQASDTVSGAAEQATETAQNAAMGAGMAPPAGAQGMGPPPGGMGRPGDGMGPPPEPTSDLVPSAMPVFKSVEGKDLKLHIFNPQGHTASSNSPALIFFHGGGFRRGSPIQGYDMSETFNPEGVVVVAAEYRLTDTDDRSLGQIISDAKSAVRYARANADSLGIDPERIVTTGHSAGAYLALSAGMFEGFDQAGEDASVSGQSNGMVIWAGGPNRTTESTIEMMGDYKLADYQGPTYVRADLPPSLFIHGTADTNIPLEPTKVFMDSLIAKGNKSSFYTIEGADHFFREPGQKEDVYGAILGFMEAEGFTD